MAANLGASDSTEALNIKENRPTARASSKRMRMASQSSLLPWQTTAKHLVVGLLTST